MVPNGINQVVFIRIRRLVKRRETIRKKRRGTEREREIGREIREEKKGRKLADEYA